MNAVMNQICSATSSGTDLLSPFEVYRASPVGRQTKRHDWIEQVYSAASRGDLDGGIDLLLQHFNRFFMSSDFRLADSLLHHIDLDRLESPAGPDLLVALLAATLPARDVLPGRVRVVSRVRQRLAAAGPDEVDALLRGLE